ncbi:G-box-binding factor 1 isoform X1 [Ziziphus jujuba]|uniref:G-box-binding factor 1 isoform X1 n=1 Tax=Ziziphus jujuba TaxID=326968 RepID=A0A6P6FS87_ZIZJJ|nr:G-box-binding factor 1 isoform X1 [Ziziphus jujuba]XP_060676190.1 G-box-binding factor 1 isoform X1 [Ziziphus jujuba]XP_060676191.1 G-box-binding factor 1 isoform X1 [Ziziphus jujuba]
MGTNEANGVVKPFQLIGDREVNVNANSLEQLVSTQNVPIAPSRSDWPTHAQAFYPYGATPHHFFTSRASVSPSFYPAYMVGNQHQIMQLYGTPVQYSAQYGHNQPPSYPNGAVFTVPQKEANPSEKDLGSMRKCKRSSENEYLTGNRLGESGNRTLPLRNDGDGALQSAPIGTEGLSDETCNTDRDFSAAKKQRYNQRLVDGAVAQTDATLQYHDVNADSGLQDSAVNMVQTKLNTGIASNWSSTKTILAKEEHDQRKERRKQSNRESAKRSRCRRQEECRKLQGTAEDLAKETSNLRAGIMRVSKECRKLKKENKSIMKGLEKMYGPDAVGDLKAEEPGSVNGDGESSSDESGNETSDEDEDA